MYSVKTTKIIVIFLLIIAISFLHYFTPLHKHLYHELFRRLYYFPILFAAIWFGLKGGLLVSLLISFIYAPHIIYQWKIIPAVELEKYLEIVLFNIVGAITGILTERERRQKIRYQEVSESLEKSYKKLQKQSETIVEIEDQLRRADRLSTLGELSAGMAHELRNPLASIKGTVEILEDDFSKESKKYEFLNILNKEVERLDNVVENYLRFAKHKIGMLKQLNINDVLNSLITLVGAQAKKNNIKISLELADALPTVEGDEEKLRQVFLNLILNSIQAMPTGGSLSIKTETVENMVETIIEDTGRGISKDNFRKIFDPFFTTKDRGTGLGLAISKRIIDGHKGVIELESKEGEGTKFIVKLSLH